MMLIIEYAVTVLLILIHRFSFTDLFLNKGAKMVECSMNKYLPLQLAMLVAPSCAVVVSGGQVIHSSFHLSG